MEKTLVAKFRPGIQLDHDIYWRNNHNDILRQNTFQQSQLLHCFLSYNGLTYSFIEQTIRAEKCHLQQGKCVFVSVLEKKRYFQFFLWYHVGSVNGFLYEKYLDIEEKNKSCRCMTDCSKSNSCKCRKYGKLCNMYCHHRQENLLCKLCVVSE